MTHVGRQWETMADKGEAREGRHTIRGTHVGRQWETKREDNTSGRRTHHPTQANVWGDNARQCAQWVRRGYKGRQDLGKADTPSNTGTHAGRQWEARRQEGGRTIQHKHTCGKTTRNIGRQGGDKTSRTQTHHPTQARVWGRDNGGKVETRRATKRKHEGSIGWETKGDKTKADTLRMR